MTTGHQKRGATALLFDRLIGPVPTRMNLVPTAVRDVYNLAELRASIGEQLGWLLNTRVPIDFTALDARTRAGTRSTIDYGLPDLTAYPVGDAQALVRLRTHLVQTIALYEPRLLKPQVRLAPSEDRGETLIVTVTGDIRIGLVVEPASFHFDIAVDEGVGNGG